MLHAWFCRFTILSLVCFVLSACQFPPRIYKIDIPQGNVVNQEMINQLKPGMFKAEVQQILGSPVLIPSPEAQRWDYIYRFKSGQGLPLEEKHLTVYFIAEKLYRLEGDWAIPKPLTQKKSP